MTYYVEHCTVSRKHIFHSLYLSWVPISNEYRKYSSATDFIARDVRRMGPLSEHLVIYRIVEVAIFKIEYTRISYKTIPHIVGDWTLLFSVRSYREAIARIRDDRRNTQQLHRTRHRVALYRIVEVL